MFTSSEEWWCFSNEHIFVFCFSSDGARDLSGGTGMIFDLGKEEEFVV